MINCALKGDRNMDLHIKVWDFGVVCVFVIAKKVQIKHLHGVSSDNVCFFLQFHWTSSHFFIMDILCGPNFGPFSTQPRCNNI